MFFFFCRVSCWILLFMNLVVNVFIYVGWLVVFWKSIKNDFIKFYNVFCICVIERFGMKYLESVLFNWLSVL